MILRIILAPCRRGIIINKIYNNIYIYISILTKNITSSMHVYNLSRKQQLHNFFNFPKTEHSHSLAVVAVASQVKGKLGPMLPDLLLEV